MEPSTPNSSDQLREALLQLLWRQWSALGVAGHVSSGGRSMIDPEALKLGEQVGKLREIYDDIEQKSFKRLDASVSKIERVRKGEEKPEAASLPVDLG